MHDSAAIALLFGLGAALAWGFSDFFAAKASKGIGPFTGTLYSNIISLALYVLFFAVIGGMPEHISMSGVAYSVAGGVLLCFALMLFFNGLHAGPVSLVAAITAAYPAVTALVAVAAFKADISAAQLGVILMVVIGVMAASNLFTRNSSERRLGKGPLLALISTVVYGTAFACLAQGGDANGWQLNTLIQSAACVAASLIFIPLVGRRERVFSRARIGLTNRFVIGAAAIGIIGMTSLMIGYTKEASGGALATAASACYPIITVLLALKHFEEELKLVPLLGAGLSITGIILLAIV